MKIYKDCFYYFIDKYKELTGKEYFYYKNRLGLELVKLKRLKLTLEQFKNFIDWLYQKKKLSSINFFSGQLNDYYSSKEYGENRAMQETLLHYEIMKIREKIIGSCGVCRKTGFLDRYNRCKCMQKFLKIRDKMKRELK